MTLKPWRALKNKRVSVSAMMVAAALAAIVVVAGLYIPETATVEIINEGTTPDDATFEPETIFVEVSTTVVWINVDSSAHTVTAVEPAGTFDSGLMEPDEEFRFKFEQVGTLDYYCKIHPVMTGNIVVE